MPLDPNIPLSMPKQPAFAEQMGQTYEMAGAMEKQKSMQEQRQDSSNLQQYLKEGGNLDTPEGLTKAMEWGKGNLSLGAYQTLVSAGQEMRKNEQQRILALAQTDSAKIDAANKKNSVFMQSANPVLMQYEEDAKKFGEQQATENFKSNWQKQVQNVAQLGVFSPQELQDAVTWTPKQAQSKLQSTEYGQKLITEALAHKKTQQDITKSETMLPLEVEKTKEQIKTERAQAARAYAEAAKAKAEAAGGGVGGKQIPQTDATGEDFLKQLSATDRATVKALAEGRTLITEIPARGGERGFYSKLVNQYDPDFTSSLGKTKAQVQKDYAAGPTSRNISSINTAIGHAGTLDKLATALKNKDSQTLNRLTNMVSKEFGNPNITNYRMAQVALGEELMRTFRGVGASVTEAEQWKQTLEGSQTPDQLKGSAKTAAELLESRIGAVDSAWKRGMKTTEGYADILDPKSVGTLQGLTGKDYTETYNLPSSSKGKAAAGTPTAKAVASKEDFAAMLKTLGVKK